jgi:hypothetical protein
MIANKSYPKKKSGKMEQDGIYLKKGDKYNDFFIAGG